MVKIRTADELNGMTVNERLYETEQFDEYDAAVAASDEAALRQVLERLHIGEANVTAILDQRINSKPMPLSVKIAIGCLALIAVALAGIGVVGVITQDEGLWVGFLVALVWWLAYRIVHRRAYARISTRVLSLLTGVVTGVVWSGCMAIGLSPGHYRFDSLSLALGILAGLPIASCWVVFFALGWRSARDYCQSKSRVAPTVMSE